MTEVHNTEKGNNNKFLFAMDIGLANEHAVPFYFLEAQITMQSMQPTHMPNPTMGDSF